jgi:UDP-N-acetylmuramoyl-tripeptide--D-alanyl-D-alanine ligase
MLVFGYRRLLVAMKFMQQDNYYNKRLFRFAYLKRNMIDTRVSLPILAAAIVAHFVPSVWWWAVPAAALAVQILRERNPKKSGIKPLVMTARAKRMFYTAFVVWTIAVATTILFTIHYSLFTYAAMALLAPMFIMAGNTLMSPVEWKINKKFIDEAKARLDRFKPLTIGITGSFGKTSMKNILHHILSTYSSSFATKRSINTMMGIVRVIREEMTAAPKYFVAEMGIGDRGQMPELVKFINPDFGIITAVGAAHLENFKRVDAVAKEKFRLSKFVAKKGGRTIINAANIDPEFIKKYAAPNDIIFTGNEVSDVRQTADGLSFILSYEGKKYEISAPVFGMHQAQNIAISFIMARLIGVEAEPIITALKTLKQTEHRLEVREEGGFVVLDDAFNSNVKGFVSAVQTGAAMKGARRLILITPGMVDLGELHAAQHAEAGRAANAAADIVIAVNPSRIEDFIREIAADKLVRAASLAEARAWLAANARPGELVLYENDLPDVYIEKVRI